MIAAGGGSGQWGGRVMVRRQTIRTVIPVNLHVRWGGGNCEVEAFHTSLRWGVPHAWKINLLALTGEFAAGRIL